ncbi:acyl-CoA dehydrogenase [Herbiconiux sp. YIM B11900]|uniref:acyl-CoA dehydrogenase n=1 Tax=Herbiconiux sp. YIM B11900 TaxID=3404131 RepID=UPI003F876883
MTGVSLGDLDLTALAVPGPAHPQASALAAWAERSSQAAGVHGATGVDGGLALARALGDQVAPPASGRTRERLELLATLAVGDVSVARVVEPHLDALAILHELRDAGSPLPGLAGLGVDASSTWGVFAAEAPGLRLTAVPDAGGWQLSGTKPWCSLAGVLSHALVSAVVERPEGAAGAAGAADAAGERRLFAVALQQPGVRAHPEAWVGRGLPTIPSGPTDFHAVRAVAVGDAGWYLSRAGFEWGGIGVAACWFGGAVGVARRVLDAARRKDDDIGRLHAGRVAASVQAAGAALASAARAIDAASGERSGVEADGAAAGASVAPAPSPSPSPEQAALLAQLTRSVVRRECEAVLAEAAAALGPAPLALDEAYAARVSDLALYLRQDHGARDEVRAGRLLSALGSPQPLTPTPTTRPGSRS